MVPRLPAWTEVEREREGKREQGKTKRGEERESGEREWGRERAGRESGGEREKRESGGERESERKRGATPRKNTTCTRLDSCVLVDDGVPVSILPHMTHEALPDSVAGL